MPLGHAQKSLDPKVTDPYAIGLVSSEEALSALRVDWNQLSGAVESPNVFMTFDWFCAWVRYLIHEDHSDRVRPHVLVLRQDKAVKAISPLVLRKSSRFGLPLRKLEFVTNHADYNDLTLGICSGSQTDAVVDFLARTTEEWDIVDLRDLRESRDKTSPIESTLDRAGLLYRIIPEKDRCLYMPISGPWRETKKQKHLRFARRAFSEFEERAQDGFRVRMVENPQAECGLLERLIAVEAQKHVGGKPSIPILGQYPEVFQALFDTLGPSGWITLGLVEQEQRLVAWRLFFRCGDRLWDYLTAYQHTFSSLSPGNLLICAAIDYGFANGLCEFDFLRGEESYKRRWTSQVRQNYRLLIWNRRWKSRLCASAYLKLRA
jgi:CelD/BcsL family acetyltransferase involved in cellulose biosynthesis